MKFSFLIRFFLQLNPSSPEKTRDCSIIKTVALLGPKTFLFVLVAQLTPPSRGPLQSSGTISLPPANKGPLVHASHQMPTRSTVSSSSGVRPRKEPLKQLSLFVLGSAAILASRRICPWHPSTRGSVKTAWLPWNAWSKNSRAMTLSRRSQRNYTKLYKAIYRTLLFFLNTENNVLICGMARAAFRFSMRTTWRKRF